VGSPAIDAAGSCAEAADQRGAARAGDCDSGAFELIPCDDLHLANDTVSGPENHLACGNVIAGPDLIVTSSGDLGLEVGIGVRFDSEFTVETGGEITVTIDPDLRLGAPP
jgi:hypothetical protein